MKVAGTSRVFGIFGDPVAHSRSPAMHNAAFAFSGIDAVYVPFHVRPFQLASAVEAIRALDLGGVNITLPHKEAVLPLLDAIEPQARLIGAVNTIVNRDGVLTGHNTDAPGFLRALTEELRVEIAGCRALLLGAGGACRAALVALAGAGAAWIGIANRTESRAQALAAEFAAALPGTTLANFPLSSEVLNTILPKVDLIVNTASVGLRGEEFIPFDWKKLRSSAAIYDMVYAAGGTPLVQAAIARGYRAADGLGMLAAQGEESFRLWLGEMPPSGVMKRQLAPFIQG